MSVIEHCNVVIVGSGILGRVLAAKTARMGQRVVVIEGPDKFGLAADTLRNHAWLQSGLLYRNAATLASAEKMSNSGQMLFELAGLPQPHAGGIFRLMADQEAEFCSSAARLNIPITKVPSSLAEEKLGVFFQSGFEHYSVPDTIFDEARLLNALAYKAEKRGAQFLKAKVRLKEHSGAKNKFVIEYDNGVLESDFTFVCAGSGTAQLLEGLSLDHPLRTFESATLVLKCGVVLQTPLLVDISEKLPSSGLAVGQHYSTKTSDGRCVIGNRDRHKLEALLSDRAVPAEYMQRLLKLVPPKLTEVFESHEAYRITSGYKTEALQTDGTPSINPWVEAWPERFPGLVAGVPGKATLAYVTAMRMLNLCDLLKKDGIAAELIPLESADSPELCHMHHEETFDGVLHEVAPKPEE